MTVNPQAARLEEIARTNARALRRRESDSPDIIIPELVLTTIVALLLSLICC